MNTKLTISFPFDIGDAVKVDKRTLPISYIDLNEEEIPDFFVARIVSVRKNTKSTYFKVAVRAPWLCPMYFEDTGTEDIGADMEKYFTYPLSAIGKTVFLESGEQIKHGKWEETKLHNGCTPDYDCVCSVCNYSGLPQYKFCPNCGAKMDLAE